jgi:hypothetical protein
MGGDRLAPWHVLAHVKTGMVRGIGSIERGGVAPATADPPGPVEPAASLAISLA